MDVKLVQSPNARSPKLMRFAESVTSDNFLHSEKDQSPILVIVSGIVTALRLLLLRNALFPIATTV